MSLYWWTEKLYVYGGHKGCRIALREDGWAVSYMHSAKVWRRGFATEAHAKAAITKARSRLHRTCATMQRDPAGLFA